MKLEIIVQPSIAEHCEGCGTGPKAEIKDCELRAGTRQVARMFLCEKCRGEAALLLAPHLGREIQELRASVAVPR